ncbi:MAG: sensor histidine kinase [bacterium]
MMQRRSTGQSSTLGLLSIVLIYITLIILILLFARQLLSEISRGTALSRFVFIPLAILLPLFLIVSVGYNINRLIKERRSGYPGSRFKVKLVIFFTFISILASIPQGVLSISFLRSTMDSWFSNQLQDTLQGSLDIALQYNRNTLTQLEDFSKSEVTARVIEENYPNTEEIWTRLTSVYPHLDAMQLFLADGTHLLSIGNTNAYLENLPPSTVEGILPRVKTGSLSIIRSISFLPPPAQLSGSEKLAVVLSVILPSGFDTKAQNITTTLQTFTQYNEFQNTFFLALLVFFSLFSFPILLLSILIGFLLSDEIIRPVVHLEDAIQRVISGDYSFRILTRSGDELAVLVDSFNSMISELEQSRTKLRQTEKVTAWQEIAQRMAHEIKNPLTPIKLSAQRIQRAYTQESPKLGRVIESSVESIAQEIEHLNQLLGEFRDFAKLPTPYFQPVDVHELISKVLITYQPSYPRVEVNTEYMEHISVSLDPHQMNRVFSNLLKNSFESIDEEKGKISISTDLVRKGHTHYCRIKIEDSGRGIPRELEQKVFHPYFTTKENGTGLGLPIVERIVSDHQGQIWFETEEQIGTTFYIDLPLEQLV